MKSTAQFKVWSSSEINSFLLNFLWILSTYLQSGSIFTSLNFLTTLFIWFYSYLFDFFDMSQSVEYTTSVLGLNMIKQDGLFMLFTLLNYVLQALQHSSRFIFRKRSGDEGIWTLDPWSGNLLRWPLDHTTPPYLIFVTFKVVQKVLVLYFVIVYFSFLRNKFLIHGQK